MNLYCWKNIGKNEQDICVRAKHVEKAYDLITEKHTSLEYPVKLAGVKIDEQGYKKYKDPIFIDQEWE